MTDNLPMAPLPDDIVDRIAREIGLEVKAHIEIMYPEAAAAVAWGSASLSIQGIIRNAMASAARAAESGTVEVWIKESRRNRRAWLAAWRKATADRP